MPKVPTTEDRAGSSSHCTFSSSHLQEDRAGRGYETSLMFQSFNSLAVLG
jgi:hypothetical protein